jgi:hypothetical protein
VSNTGNLAEPRVSFTLSGYKDLLKQAMAFGYQITSFESFTRPGSRPVMLLRHDVDHSLRSAQTIAEMEAEYGVTATYFVLVTCDFYNVLSGESRGILKRISALGHEIGLHYESSRYLEAGGLGHLQTDLRLLEDMVGRKIKSAAQHIPSDSVPVDLTDFIDNEAYEPRFTTGAMTYLSDSSMTWRQIGPYEVLNRRKSFQLLTHPMHWVNTFEGTTEALAYALAEEQAYLEKRYRETVAYYTNLLLDRDELDARFRERRAQAVVRSKPRPS